MNRMVTALGTPGMAASSVPSSPVVVGKKYDAATFGSSLLLHFGSGMQRGLTRGRWW